MTNRPSPSTRRILLAISISVLAHSLVLWLPRIPLPHFEKQLPPLLAKLEPLPVAAPQQPKKLKPKPATLPAPLQDMPAPLQASAVSPAESLAVSAPAATDSLAAAADTSEPTLTPHPLLPKHAQLSFAVFRGTDGFRVGEIQHRMDIADGRYSIQATTQTTGLARWFKSYNLNQNSSGTVVTQGLKPESFSEEKNDSGSMKILTASFDWHEHVLRFSHGGDTSLHEGAQDSLSILYQLSQLSINREWVQVSISNGKKLENYILKITLDENISTAIGELKTVHLHKMHDAGEPGLEIWLAMEYRLLPVKIQYFEPDGTVAASITITDIRVSDD